MSTTISVKYLILGVTVVRGKDWDYENQDGGEGKTGVIIDKSVNGWVEVLWENNNKDSYRIGCERKYDLYFATEKDALLQEAMERFPSGCSYIDTSGDHYKNIKYDYPHWYGKSTIALKEDEGLVYNNGVWAERTDLLRKPSLLDEAKERFTVNTVFSNTNLGFSCTDIKIIKTPEFEIRTDQILIKDGGCNKEGSFTIYKDGKWAEIVPVKEERVEVFPGIYIGDIVVSLRDVGGARKIGDIFKVLPASKKDDLFYTKTKSSADKSSWRLATPAEIKLYNNGGKNINDISKKELSPLELCKQMYSVGDVVETTIDGETHVEKITQEILDELSVYGHDDSISCMYLKGFLYRGKTKQYAKIISNDFHSQTKTNQNGKHKQDTEVRSFKVQRSNLSIPTGIRTGGSGLKSADRKVGFRSNGSNYQERFGSC